MFSKDFRKRGTIGLKTYFANYRKGDVVDIKGDGAFQTGMPHKVHHGTTGRVFNVTKRAVGIIVNKKHNGRIIPKRINVRVDRIKVNNEAVKKAKEAGSFVDVKRVNRQPREAHTVKTFGKEAETVAPIPYEFII